MDIFEAIETRRSEAHLLPREVDREIILKVLSAGMWAPNHHHTEPWHFHVFQGESRQKLADAVMNNFHRDHPLAAPQEEEKAQRKNPRRILESPLVVVVSSDAGKDEMETTENYAASACAVQNILLAAKALGLGAFWRTGEAAYTSPNAIKELLGLPENSTVVAILLMGYPGRPAKAAIRKPLTEKMTWV